MKNEDISRALSYIDEEILKETEEIRTKQLHPQQREENRRKEGIRWLSAGNLLKYAAVLLILFGIVYFNTNGGKQPTSDIAVITQTSPDVTTTSEIAASTGTSTDTGAIHSSTERETPEPLPELPMIAITKTQGGCGLEILRYRDFSEYKNANPWNRDMHFDTLPVFKNPVTTDPKYHHITSEIDFENMRGLLIQTAEALGASPESIRITDDTPSPEEQEKIRSGYGGDVPEGFFNPTSLLCEHDDWKIEISPYHTITVHFTKEVKLPEQYTFRHDAAYEQLLETAAYLKSVYGAVMAYRSPKADITGGDYSSDKKPHFQLSFFDADGNEIDQILHYHFESTHFAPSDSGRLFLIRKFNTRTEKVADYPVISVEEAERLLHEKDFSRTVFYAFQKSDREQILKNIVHTELIYNTGIYDEYFLPIYRFYIEVPGSQEQGGIKGFGWYDIPAVHAKYLTEADEQSRD